MSVSFSPAAYTQVPHGAQSGTAGYGASPPSGAQVAALGAALNRGSLGGATGSFKAGWPAAAGGTSRPRGPSREEGANPDRASALSTNRAVVDRKARALLDANRPIVLASSHTHTWSMSLEGDASIPIGATETSAESDATKKTLCTMLSNYATAVETRDLLFQTLPAAERAALADIHTRWRATALRVHRTTCGVLFLCLQLAGDPPGHPRISPRARLEAWVDASEEAAKLIRRNTDTVVEALEHQYKTLDREIHLKRQQEPTQDEARTALAHQRHRAHQQRMLVHYNGHGMPDITPQGELWFYDTHKENFVPMNIQEVSTIAQSPTVYVIDSNCAGYVLHSLRHGLDAWKEGSDDVILCACADGQVLPSNPVLPADFFTACLTTPLRAALVWYAHYSDRQPLLPTVDLAALEHIPGTDTDKKTPRGELAFILCAVADTVAWCTLDPLRFYTLFRQDTFMKNLLRNFLLADRLMRETGCTPRSSPALPHHAHMHPAWQAWEVALEGVLAQVPGLLRNPQQPYTPSPYWRDQLSSFEVGLAIGDYNGTSGVPEQLPCVILALGQSAHRCRALVLLARYFEQGPRAVHHGLACGVLGYTARLLRTETQNLLLLNLIWLHVLRANPAAASAELVRAGAEEQLVWLLSLADPQVSVKYVHNTLEDLPGPSPYVLPSSAVGSAAPNPMAGAGSSLHGMPSVGSMAGGRSFAQSPGAGAAASSVFTASPGSMARSVTPGGAPSPGAGGAPAGGTVPTVTFVAAVGLSLPQAKAIAAFILCNMINGGGERTAVACWNAGLANACLNLMESESKECVSWACLLLGRLCETLPHARTRLVIEMAYRRSLVAPLLASPQPTVRASTVHLLGKLLLVDVRTLEGEDQARAGYVLTSILRAFGEELHGISTDARIEIAVAVLAFVVHCRYAIGTTRQQELLRAVKTGDFGPEGLQFRVIETWRRATVRSRLAAGAGLGDAAPDGRLDADAAGPATAGAGPHGGPRAAQTAAIIDVEKLPLPSNRRQPAPPAPPTATPLSGAGGSTAMPPEVVGATPTGAAAADPESGLLPPPLPAAMVTQIAELAFDAALLCRSSVVTADDRLRSIALDALNFAAKGVLPASNRIAREGHQLALGLDHEARHILSDQERCCERRNEDLVRQALLRAEDTTSILTRLGQPAPTAPTTSGSPRNGPGSHVDPASRSTDAVAQVAGPVPAPPALKPFTLPVLQEAHSGDAAVTALAFRELEPRLFSVDTTNTFAVTNYEKLRAPQVVSRAALPASLGTVRSLHVVNDLSSDAHCLCVGSTGLCMVVRSGESGHHAGEPFLTFLASALTHLSTASGNEALGGAAALVGTATLAPGVNIVTAYRGRDGVLFFAGVPNEVRCVSLGQEAIEQVLPLAGDTVVTALHNTPSNDLFVGSEDGTVKLFDTRQREGYWTFSAAIGEASRNARISPRVVSVGRYESSPHDVVVGYRTGIKVYDARKRGAARRTIDVVGGGGGTGGSTNSTALPSQLLTNLGVHQFLPLYAATLADGTLLPITAKGCQATEVEIRLPPALPASTSPAQSVRTAGTATQTSAEAPGHVLACHPHRPMVAVGKHMVVLTPDEVRLSTSLAI